MMGDNGFGHTEQRLDSVAGVCRGCIPLVMVGGLVPEALEPRMGAVSAIKEGD